METSQVKFELLQEKVDNALKVYEDKWCSAHFYEGTPEGRMHRKEASVLRGAYLMLGIIDEAQNTQIVKRAINRAEKSRRGK